MNPPIVDIDAAIDRYLAASRGIKPQSEAELFAHYYRGLLGGAPGARDAGIRNMEFGLKRFPKEKRILDVGCGFGLQAYVFASAGYPVTGVDLKPRRDAIARYIINQLDVPGLTLEVGDAAEWLSPDSLGGIWIHRAIHQIKPLEPFLDRVRKALTPDGYLIASTHSGRGRLSVMRRALASSGMEIDAVDHHGFLTALPSALRPSNTPSIDRRLSNVPGIRRLGGTMLFAARPVVFR